MAVVRFIHILAFCVGVALTTTFVSAEDKRLLVDSGTIGSGDIDALIADIESLKATVGSQEDAIAAQASTISTHGTLVAAQAITIATQGTTLANQEATIDTLRVEITGQGVKLSLLESAGTTGTVAQGSTYTRWGRTVCEGDGVELVYKGYTAGGPFDHDGGAADFICLAQEPLWGVYDDADHSWAPRVYGTEYGFYQYADSGIAMFGQDLQDHDAPCAVCHTPRATSIMIPGRNQCYPGWIMEYSGYLVSGNYNPRAASNYACVDLRPEVIAGDEVNQHSKNMYVAEAECGSLSCPPYVQNREITCVVCSK